VFQNLCDFATLRLKASVATFEHNYCKINLWKLKRLSSLQLELLKIYSFEPLEEDLLRIKQLLAKFFAEKLVSNVEHSIESNNISDETLETWLNE